jgi:hypothetical protein
MTAPAPNFTPALDVALILHALLDMYERRVGQVANLIHKAVRCDLTSLPLPGYHSQIDPVPRQIANEQLQTLEQSGWLKLNWLPGETGHLLASVTLVPDRADSIFALLQRTPQAAQRARLSDLLLGERFRFADWRLNAIQQTLDHLKTDRSPVPFSLTDAEFNRDLLIALAALDDVHEETPYRVFSVQVFNDSKRFEALIGAVCTLARRRQSEWRAGSNAEILRELNLTANPTHLHLHGAWQLIDEAGQLISLDGFDPSVGLAAAQAQHVHRVRVAADRIICVENQTTFYELIRHKNLAKRSTPAPDSYAAICLWGNPSPACRHLLSCLPPETPLHVWADIDYGGLNILAQLREQVNRRAQPYRMDIETLEAHARWARPLTSGDIRHLNRLLRHAVLADLRPLIEHMLRRGLKLEQEAITPA